MTWAQNIGLNLNNIHTFVDVVKSVMLFLLQILVTEKVSENLNVIANEPSLAFFRVQEHVRKSLPQLVETKVSSVDFLMKLCRTSWFHKIKHCKHNSLNCLINFEEMFKEVKGSYIEWMYMKKSNSNCLMPSKGDNPM